MRTKMIKTAIAIALLGIAVDARAQAMNSAEADVRKVVDALFEGMRKGDSAMVRPLFHPKARLITFDSRRPAAEIEESAEGFIKQIGSPRTEVFDERLSNVRVMVDGSLASVWADYKFFRGTTLNHCGIDHFLLVREDGAWKIIELADTRRRVNC